MRRVAAPALLVAIALVSGCGGDHPATTSATPTSEESSPGSPHPSADVASGIRLSRPNSAVTAPEGWTHGRRLVSDEDDADSPDHLSYLSLAEIEAFGSTMSAAELGRTRVESSVSPRPPRQLPEAELDGAPVYHVAGFVSADQYLEEFGAIRNDRVVTLTFSFNRQVPASEREDVVAR